MSKAMTPRILLITFVFAVAAVALLLGVFLLYVALSSQQSPTSAKAEIQPSAEGTSSATKSEEGGASANPTPAPDPSLAPGDDGGPNESAKQDYLGKETSAGSPDWPDRSNLSDPGKWVAVAQSPDYQTFFLKDIAGKGSANAMVAMLTNFTAPRPLPGTQAAFQSSMYVISIDCTAPSGVPVKVVNNTGQYLSGDDLDSAADQKNLVKKMFNPTDPLFLFACK